MESRARRIWSWAWLSFTTCSRLGVVVAAFVIAYARLGGWVAAIVSLALLTVVAPVIVILVSMRCLSLSDAQARRLVSQVYRARLVLALCLLAASLATGLVWLWIMCAVCALWAALSWVVVKLLPPSDARV